MEHVDSLVSNDHHRKTKKSSSWDTKKCFASKNGGGTLKRLKNWNTLKIPQCLFFTIKTHLNRSVATHFRNYSHVHGLPLEKPVVSLDSLI